MINKGIFSANFLNFKNTLFAFSSASFRSTAKKGVFTGVNLPAYCD